MATVRFLHSFIAVILLGGTTIRTVSADDINYEFWLRNDDGFCNFDNGKGVSSSTDCKPRDWPSAVWGLCGVSTAINKVYCCGAGNGICHREGDTCDGVQGNSDQVYCEYPGKKWCCQKTHERCEPPDDRFYGASLCVPIVGTNPHWNQDPKIKGYQKAPTFTVPVSIPGATYPSKSQPKVDDLKPATITTAAKETENDDVADISNDSSVKESSRVHHKTTYVAGANGPAATESLVLITAAGASDDSKGDTSKGLPIGAIAGGVVGGVIGGGVIVVLAWIYARRRRANQKTQATSELADTTAIHHKGYSSGLIPVEEIYEAPSTCETSTMSGPGWKTS